MICDYKGHFGSKYFETPYRSGFIKESLKIFFAEKGFRAHFIPFSEAALQMEEFQDQLVIYTSSEDPGYDYKQYIEDVVFGLELTGAYVLPSYKYLRANNNKVFMEFLRDQLKLPGSMDLKAQAFGSLNELDQAWTENYPVVLKTSTGASGSGVFLAYNRNELNKRVRQMGASSPLKLRLKERLRKIKHKGYQPDNPYRKKFILQRFIPGLQNDWKIYLFGNRLYVFYRPVFKHRGFRASGGGYPNYYYGINAMAPEGLFDFAYEVYKRLNVPHASLDIAYDGERFYLIEFQAVYFGTAGIYRSDEYFIKEEAGWLPVKENLDQEKVYVDSIVEYVTRNNFL